MELINLSYTFFPAVKYATPLWTIVVFDLHIVNDFEKSKTSFKFFPKIKTVTNIPSKKVMRLSL